MQTFSLGFIAFISGFVSTNPEPRFVTINEIQTEPDRVFARHNKRRFKTGIDN